MRTGKSRDTTKTKFETLQIDGTDYKTTFTKKWAKRVKWVTPDPCDISARIPGTILELHVKKGSKVKKGDLLLILEAMKMENRITAPFDCKIKDVCIKEGEHVTKNTLMLKLNNTK
ncbi:hypothetical protein FACS1894199_19380 [Bacteroidia bacterium]|nr:hypothetical protein FACS1894199_19380 [Bacteroidia bacterium]